MRLRSWPRGLVAAAGATLLAVVACQPLPTAKSAILRVSQVTGSTHYFGSNGGIESALSTETSFGAGDTLETLSRGGWIELALRDSSILTIGERSILRILDPDAPELRFEMRQGNLWVRPAKQPAEEAMFIQTPTATLELRAAQFDIQTSAAETRLRVNKGSARVTRRVDGRFVEVPADHQATVSLSRTEALAVIPQPRPIIHWVCDLWQFPEVIRGRWLPATGTERARLGAEPLHSRNPDVDSVTLRAVVLAAWSSSERPALLKADSRLRFRGRTQRPQTVRFGFNSQKMRDVFAGTFEVDIQPDFLGPAGESWEVELPLRGFRPPLPQLASSPDGLELTDVYAMTMGEDAGLEISFIGLVPSEREVSYDLRRIEVDAFGPSMRGEAWPAQPGGRGPCARAPAIRRGGLAVLPRIGVFVL